MEHIKEVIGNVYYLSIWKECNKCHYMVSPERVGSRTIYDKIYCDDCVKSFK